MCGNNFPPAELTFSYDASGLAKWGNVSKACNAKNQSPIDLLWTKSAYSGSDSFFMVNGSTQKPKSIEVKNNGNGLTFKMKFAEKFKPNITGGPLGNKTYKLESFQLHWGGEHTFNGVKFAAEIEFLYINSKYETLTQASTKKDGLAVLSFVYNSIPQESYFSNVVLLDLLPKVTEPKSKYTETKNLFTVADLIPAGNFTVISYVGSLTSPPCTGNVTIIVGEPQLWINEKELEALKTIKNKDKKPVTMNNRPIQDTNDRKPVIFLPPTE